MQRIFSIKKELFFQKNDNIINTLYLPLIGQDSINLYNMLITLDELINISDLKQKWTHYELLSKLKIDWDNFESSREKLEAVGLLVTQEHYFSKERIYRLCPNKSFDEFISNKNLLDLLLNRLDENEINKINLLIESANRQENSYLNISKDLTLLMDSDELEVYYAFNFNQLTLDLIAKTGEKIILEENVMKLIESYYINYELSYNRVLESVLNSLSSKNKISIKILESKLDDSLYEYKEEQNNLKIDINRKFEIFTEEYNPDKYQDIISDYKKYKSENYLVSILKSDLNYNELELIKTMREENGLKDEIINVIIDYSLFKNNGRFIIKYTKAIAKTFMINRFFTIRESINWFNNILNKENNKIKSSDNKTKSYNDPLDNYKESKYYKYWGSNND